MRLTTLALLAVALGCASRDPAPESGTTTGATVPTGAGTGTGTPTGGTTFEPPGEGRNDGEIVLPGDLHPQGIPLVAALRMPEGDGPFPAAVLLHGSGGLFQELTPGDPCSQDLESTFDEVIDILLSEGVAVLAPSSFYSRDERFCEDNEPDYLAFAPPDIDDRAERRIASRTYDLLTAATWFADHPDIDGDRMMFLGFSNGGSIVTHYLHHALPTTFETFFDDEAVLLAAVPYVAIPDPRPLPVHAMVVSPGCGFQGAIGFSVDSGTDDVDLYYPSVPVDLQIGTADDVPDECTIQVPGFDGRRELQVLEYQQRMGIDPADTAYGITLHPDGPHDLWGDPTAGPLVQARLRELAQAL